MSLSEDLRRPFNAISLLVGMAGLALAVYFYFTPRRDRSLSYLYTGESKIFDSKSSSPRLRFSDDQGNAIVQDVWVVTLTFWNSGSEPIEPAEIRKALKIVVVPESRIFDSVIVQEKDPEVSKIRLTPDLSPASAPGKTVQVEWQHLDPGHGAKLQAIVGTNQPIKLRIEADIVGISHFRNEGVLSNSIAYSLLAIPGVFMVAYAFSRHRKRELSFREFVIDSVLLLVFSVCVGFLLVCAATLLLGETPPF